MTKDIVKDDEGRPVGLAFFETGKSEIQCMGFTLFLECKFEMEETEHGWVSVGFQGFERITIKPDSDVAKDVPYPEWVTLRGWVDYHTEIQAEKEAEQDAERRANEEG
jgi:hypothetical protein